MTLKSVGLLVSIEYQLTKVKWIVEERHDGQVW
jgi:hypothetical protein